MKTAALLQLKLDLIDEDTDQPRKEFDPATLQELSLTIKERGVKTPISVRKKGKRYLINHGARRYRASKLAGNTTIPAYVDEDYSKADQVIENLHRDNLSAREIADFIGRELAQGKSKAQIARDIGKSKAFITQYSTLLDLPEPIADIFSSGRCVNISIISELVKAFAKSPNDVINWLAYEEQEITKYTVKLLRDFLEEKYGEQVDVVNMPADALIPGAIENEDNSDETPIKPNKNGEAAIELLDQLYGVMQKQKDVRVSNEFINALNSGERKIAEAYLRKHFANGKKSKHAIKLLMEGLKDKSYSTKGAGAFSLVAFMYGVTGEKEFSFSEILDNSYN